MEFTIPLLHDHHNHLNTYSAFSAAIDLYDIKNNKDAIAAIESKISKKGFTIAIGWNNSVYDLYEEDFNHLPPTIICNLSLHQYIINQAAKNIISESNPEILTNFKSSDLLEKNLPYILAFITNLIPFDKTTVNSFIKKLESQGIYKIDDMFITSKYHLDYIADSELNSRLINWCSFDFYNELTIQQKNQIYGIKLFTDGALGSSTAALKHGYLKTNGNGILTESDESLTQNLEKAFNLDLPLAIHAIGDRATEQIASVLKTLYKQIKNPIRIEHCQFIDKNTARIYKDLGIILSMQPNFNYDSVYYSDRLNNFYKETNNPFRMLIDDFKFEAGKDLLLGSDGMPHGVEFAVNQSLFPPYNGQQLTLEEFQKAYCMNNTNKGEIKLNINQKERKVQIKEIIKAQKTSC
ncbi:MAG: hypothetical protein C0594_09440 [Marinilabiliales bacterium]|nr:MAG: hypothetical protein C0594_09440 [Marinilabiliales bacterium]